MLLGHSAKILCYPVDCKYCPFESRVLHLTVLFYCINVIDSLHLILSILWTTFFFQGLLLVLIKTIHHHWFVAVLSHLSSGQVIAGKLVEPIIYQCYMWGLNRDSFPPLRRVMTAPGSVSQISKMDPVTTAKWCKMVN